MKKENKYSLRISFALALVFLLNGALCFAQQDRAIKIDSVYRKNGLSTMATSIKKNGWVHFKEDTKYDRKSFFKDNKQKFGLRNDDELELVTVNTDDDGMEHHKYVQTYKGIPVEYTMVITHVKDGDIRTMNGRPALNIDLDVNPSIPADYAKSVALYYVIKENTEKGKNNNLSDFEQSDPELVILPKIENTKIVKNYLAYKINTSSKKFAIDIEVYIDAQNSEVITSVKRIKNSTIDSYSNMKGGSPLNITFNSGVLYCDEKPRGSATTVPSNACYFDLVGSQYFSGHLVTYKTMDNSNSSTVFNCFAPLSAFDAHWGVEKSLEYFSQLLDRSSWDNNGGSVYVKANSGSCSTNCYGTIYSDDGCANIRTIAEEFSHSVVHNECNFYHEYLDEGFANIFGSCIEIYAYGDHDSYDYLPNSSIGGYFLNYECGVPYHYKGCGWCTDSETGYDCRGDGYNSGYPANWKYGHRNARPLWHWFYILARGGKGWVPPEGTQCQREAVDAESALVTDPFGLYDTELLTYMVLKNYLTPNADYPDVADCSIEAALDKWDVVTATNVYKAWKAINVTSTAYIPVEEPVSGALSNATYIGRTISTSGITTVANGVTTAFAWGDGIALENGFHAYPGCRFSTRRIKDQANSGWYKSAAATSAESMVSNTEKQTPISNNIGNNDQQTTIYPNPNQGFFVVESANQAVKSISVSNSLGTIVFSQTGIQDSKINITLPTGSKGVYFVKLGLTHKSEVRKIVVE